MKWLYRWGLPLLLMLLIRVWKGNPVWVEDYYTHGIFPWISGLQQRLFGWLPFSFGDLLYGVAVLWLIRRLALAAHQFGKEKNRALWWRVGLEQGLKISLWIYIAFNLLWGLNYNRPSLHDRLQLSAAAYSTDTLQQLTQLLQDRMHQNYPTDTSTRNILIDKRKMFHNAYQYTLNPMLSIPENWPRKFSMKKSIYSYLGCYLGYTGYYNPFTGEAQVNTLAPDFTLPFTSCHELGHQLGYAKENEANYAGFLAAARSSDPLFRYSAYLDMYLYAVRELYVRDTAAGRRMQEQLQPGVRRDLQALRDYVRRYQNPVEPYIEKIYAQYLRANEQPSGMKSYNEVVAILIATLRTHGRDAI